MASNKNPHPLISNGESFEERVRRITKPIFDKVLKENIKNTMSVGVDSKPIKFFWRPNNYRLKVPFIKGKFNLTPHKKASFPMPIKVSNYGAKVTVRNYDGITLMKDKNSITAIYSLKSIIGKKAWYLVECKSLEDMRERIDMKIKEIENMCIDRINRFISHFGGRVLLYKKEWIRHEDGVHGEDFIDQIPKELIIHDTYFKKVYTDHPEFKSPTFMKNYISNRAIEDLTPELAKEMGLIKQELAKNQSFFSEGFKSFTFSLGTYNQNIELHLSTLQEMRDTLIEIRNPFFVRWINYFRRNKK